MSGACSTYGGEERRIERVLVGESEGKRPHGISSRRREDNIKMCLQKLRCGGMDWAELSQDRDS